MLGVRFKPDAPLGSWAAATTVRIGGVVLAGPLASFLERPEKQLRRGGFVGPLSLDGGFGIEKGKVVKPAE
jgi:hypothetical protein